uniref:Myosin motor domain-containing protein n=1 Tax=Ditylum brightwellii TaxID=49249 RepID=A0A6S8WDV1_9STRA
MAKQGITNGRCPSPPTSPLSSPRSRSNYSPGSPKSPPARLSVIRTESLDYVSSAVFVKDPTCGWRPAELQSQVHKSHGEAIVGLTPHTDIDYTQGYYKNAKAAARARRKSYGSRPQHSSSVVAVETAKAEKRQGSASWAPSWSSPSPNRPARSSILGACGSLPSLLPRCPSFSDTDGESICSATSSVCSTPPGAEPNTDRELLTCMTIDLEDYVKGELPLQDLDSLGDIYVRDDLSDIPFLHEASILYNLAARHSLQKPYTRAGVVIVAMNPFKWIDGLYSEEKREQYSERYVWNRVRCSTSSSSLGDPEPHVYEASSMAYRGLIIEGKDQSILVSGETGAGKTETVKILMSHLATFDPTKKQRSLSSSSLSSESFVENCDPSQTPPSPPRKSMNNKYLENINKSNQVVQRVIDANVLLEAFGNAKTPRNDNSSRFSKYTKLQFNLQYFGGATPACELAGSICETFLLEKSRVVTHMPSIGERTFHIFYQLLAAPDEYKASVWSGLSGRDASSFQYVGTPSTNVIENMTDASRWENVYNELKVVGITGDKLSTLMRALCVVLQLGNLVFEANPDNEDGSVITSAEELELLSDILGVSSDEILQSLTVRTVATSRETMQALRNTSNAKETRDALAKEIYAATFDWLVVAINDATCAEKNYKGEEKPEKFGVIALLDLFGFESFENNYFEQLCINHANERLQKKFTEDIFRSVNKEYEFEGIDLSDVVFNDNGDILKLIEGRLGLIDILNEECLRPMGSDSAFVNKIYANNKKVGSPLFSKRGFQSKEFGIHHYAGKVKYDASDIVMKNTDALPPDVINCVVKCNNSIIATKFQQRQNQIDKATTASTLKHLTVWTKFSNQLSKLMDSIAKTNTRYVRCMVPNKEKKPLVTDLRFTATQLHYAGIVSAVTISREAFPEKMDMDTVVERFSFMQSAYGKARHCKDDKSREKVTELLAFLLEDFAESTGDKSPFLCGKTRTYFKDGVLEYLEAKRILAFGLVAMKIQHAFRRRQLKLHSSATIIQCMVRQRNADRALLTARVLHEKDLKEESLRALRQQSSVTTLAKISRFRSFSFRSKEKNKEGMMRRIKQKITVIGMFSKKPKKKKRNINEQKNVD